MKKQSKYQEVVSYLKNGIESGRFPTGSRLPSIRQLSLDFHCSKGHRSARPAGITARTIPLCQAPEWLLCPRTRATPRPRNRGYG